MNHSSVSSSQFSTNTFTPPSSSHLRGLVLARILISGGEVGGWCTPEPLCKPDPHLFFDTLQPIHSSWGQGTLYLRVGLPSLWGPSGMDGGKVNLVILPVVGGASDVGLEAAESFSSVAATLVIRVTSIHNIF